MSYQAVIRNSNGELITNKTIGMKISIMEGSSNGSLIYTETQTVSTNANGLVTTQIGGEAGFSAIDWANGIYFIKTETDPLGGTNYTNTGTSQLLSVPYALHSKTAENIVGGITETDPTFSISPASGITATEVNNWNNKLDVEEDGSVTNEIQVLSISNDTIYLSNGGFAKLPNVVNNVNITNDSLFVMFQNGDVTNMGYIGRGAPGSTMATVSTINSSNISYTTATVDAEVSAHGGEFVMSRGICLSTSENPTLNDKTFANGTGVGTFTINISELIPNTTYYARAFASNAIGTSYGNQISFTTLAQTTPTLTTKEIYNISLSSAMSGGNITDNGGLTLEEKGICWSLNPSPTIADNKDIQVTENENYNALMNGLTSNTTYYVRAYATNILGTTYGNELFFTLNLYY